MCSAHMILCDGKQRNVQPCDAVFDACVAGSGV